MFMGPKEACAAQAELPRTRSQLPAYRNCSSPVKTLKSIIPDSFAGVTTVSALVPVVFH